MFTAGPAATQQLTVISWNTLVLSPAGKSSDELTYQASLRLPEGWKFGGALRTASDGRGPRRVRARLASRRWWTAPLLAGAHLRTIELSEGPIAHRIHVGGRQRGGAGRARRRDRRLEAARGRDRRPLRRPALSLLRLPADALRPHRALRARAPRVERQPHRRSARSSTPTTRLLSLDLLPHEMTHSWNGKYRRPAALMPASFEKPMEGELLWVYEGLTDYLGLVFAARSGLADARGVPREPGARRGRDGFARRAAPGGRRPTRRSRRRSCTGPGPTGRAAGAASTSISKACCSGSTPTP